MKGKSTITNKARLLCADCDTMQRVKLVRFDTYGDTDVTLHCGHKRGELLPLKDGRVSIEHIERREAIAYTLFPALRTAA